MMSQTLTQKKKMKSQTKPPVKPPRDYYPMTPQLGFVNHLLENIDWVFKHKKFIHSNHRLKPLILAFRENAQGLCSLLLEIPERRKEEDADIKDNILRISNVAYELEYAVDSYLVSEIHVGYCVAWVRALIKELQKIEGEAQRESGSITSIVMDAMFGMSMEQLNVVPIVDPPDLHIEPLVSSTNKGFVIQTWSSVSSYRERKKEVFLQLCNNISSRSSEWEDEEIIFPCNISPLSDRSFDRTPRFHLISANTTEAELKIMLYEYLDGLKYIVILEDVRDVDALTDIVRALPERYGTILVTTQSPEVASKCRYFHGGDILNKISKDHSSTTQQANKPTIDNDVVGFVEETQSMIQRLILGSKELGIISISGMAGQGKTTLAMKLYNDFSVVNYFDIRAWCYVSQVYDKRGLLSELLGQVGRLYNTLLDKNVDELAEMLYKHLKGQRFLIFLDDMWKVDVWNDLHRCFPNDNYGSRILFTTRIEKLASQAKSGSIEQQLRQLSDEESWELLRKKVFQNRSCPPELLGVGKKIATSCRGLPLSVVLMAGFLEKMKKDVVVWEHIGSTLSSRILSDATQGKAIIEMSYKHLPDFLKPCFLYFGAYMEDREVSVSKLVRLWVAEGFVKFTGLKSLEDTAEDYLMDLIRRSLLTVAQSKSNGGVKFCRIHDLLHEFCLTKAVEENFMERINSYDEQFPSSKIYLRRLCIHSSRDQFVKFEPSGPFLRSLLFFAPSELDLSYSYDIASIFRNFKFATILDLEDIKIGESFEAIMHLILLRYLAVQCLVDSIPSSIANLLNLETLVFKGLGSKVIKVPDSILNMERLRHVHINESVSLDSVPSRLEMPSVLDNLQTFSTLSLAYGDYMEKLLRKLLGIRKLKCIFLDSWDDVGNCNQLPNLEFLSQLVSLNVCYHGLVKYPYIFNLPLNLKKLTLSNFHMSWNEISQLTKFDNLEVLKLKDNAFEGSTWEMEELVFPKLKFLKLDNLNLAIWSAPGNENFPRLEHLVLNRCEELEEIPSDIGEYTLEMIEVMWCNPSVATSVENIKEERLEFGNEGLEIRIHPKVSDQ